MSQPSGGKGGFLLGSTDHEIICKAKKTTESKANAKYFLPSFSHQNTQTHTLHTLPELFFLQLEENQEQLQKL